MVRSFIILVAVSSVFLLSACGNNNLNKPANIDNTDAVQFKTGKSRGHGSEIVVKEFDDKEQLVEVQGEKVFVEPPLFDVDWDSKTIVMTGEVSFTKDGKQVSEKVVYSGSFDKDGYAILRPPKDSKVVSLAVTRCTELCENLVTDVKVRETINGVQTSRQQQISYSDKRDAKENLDEIEVGDHSSGLGANQTVESSEKEGSGRKEEPKPKKSNRRESTRGSKKALPKPISDPEDAKNQVLPEPINEEEEEEDVIEEEITDPGITTSVPFLINDAMLDNRDKDINVLQFQNLGLFPIPLGTKYPGIAQGSYSRGWLSKSTEIQSNIGFKSMRRSKANYGSGLLIKTIEEAGKLYDKLFPKSIFGVNDLANKNGGKVKGHASHQNGLDVDVQLPWLSDGKSVDYAKAWAIVKSFASLGYVEIIILEPAKIQAMCKYIKSTGEKDYAATFSKMYKDSAITVRNKKTGKRYKKYVHTRHMHVRLQCTEHNKGCKTAIYTPSKRGVCE